MSKPIIKIVNAETGEEIEREMNVDELKQYQIDEKVQKDKLAAEQSNAAAKVALLERLGITEDEAALLLK
jgi:hypothetical protein